MKIYITKYALTKGIIEDDAIKIDRELSKTMAVVDNDGWGRKYYHGDEFHYSETAARIKADKMRLNRIKALEKRIAKLKSLKFKCP